MKNTAAASAALSARSGTESHCLIEQKELLAQCQTALMRDVVQMADDERERFITSTGLLMQRAYRLGDRTNALALQQCMYAAIHARSPAQRERMEAEIRRRIDEGVGYFASEAAADQGRRAMGATA